MAMCGGVMVYRHVKCSLERGRGMTKQRPALRTEDTEDMGSSVTRAINIYQPLIHRPQQYCSIHYHNGMGWNEKYDVGDAMCILNLVM